jgi:hypothetical protein
VSLTGRQRASPPKVLDPDLDLPAATIRSEHQHPFTYPLLTEHLELGLVQTEERCGGTCPSPSVT